MNLSRTDQEKIVKYNKFWEDLITSVEKNLKKELSDLEVSALQSWVLDCFDSFNKIYFKLANDLLNSSIKDKDYEFQHDHVFDIYDELKHICNHIKDADKGFIELINVLAHKAK